MGWTTALTVGKIGLDYIRGSKSDKEAKKAINDMYAQFHGIEPPSYEDLVYQLEQGQYIGDLTPENMTALKLDKSRLESVTGDEKMKQKQEDVLKKFEEMSEGGYTEADKAMMREAGRTVAAEDVSRRKAILRGLAQRGTLDSGQALLSQEMAAQHASEQLAGASDRAIQEGLRRSMESAAKTGQMAGDLYRQDFEEKSQAARAADAITQANLANRQAILEANVKARNRAAQQNLAARQQHEYERAVLANKQKQMEVAAKQQEYQNRLDMADRRAERIAALNKQRAAADKRTSGAIGGLFDIGLDMFGKTSTGGSQPNLKNQLAKNNKALARQQKVVDRISARQDLGDDNWEQQRASIFDPSKKYV